MGQIKTFSEFINESFSPIKDLANNIYMTLEKDYAGNFHKPLKGESPHLSANSEVWEIIFDNKNIFDNDNFVFYQIFVADNAPLENNVNSSLWIEYGENGYIDGPESWCLYYDTENDIWESTSEDDVEESIMDVLIRITSLVNPKTKYTKDYIAE